MGRPRNNTNPENTESVKEKDANSTVDESKESLGQILKEHKEDHYNFEERSDWEISTGSLLLDTAIGGHLNPCLVRICGANNEGKTPQTLEIVRNFLNTVPNSKAFWVYSEGRGLSKENVERCGLTFVYDYEKWEIGTIFVLESNVYEVFIKCVKKLVVNNTQKIKYCFVVDSIDGLILKDDKSKEIDQNSRVAGTPMLSKKMLQSLSLGMFKFGHLMILISQVTAEIKIDPYAKTPNRGGTFSGGNSLLHGSDWIFEFGATYNGDYILDNPNGKLNDGKSKTIGKWTRVTIQKSALESSRKQMISYPIKFGKKPSGIWLEYEIVDTLIAWELIKKAGPWFSFTDSLMDQLKEAGFSNTEKQHQGMDNLRSYLEKNPEIMTFLYKKLKNVLSN